MILLACFNSIKVQLERSDSDIDGATSILFQFHKGSIRTDTFKRGSLADYLFQFHKGSIRTLYAGVQ